MWGGQRTKQIGLGRGNPAVLTAVPGLRMKQAFDPIDDRIDLNDRPTIPNRTNDPLGM